MAEQEFMSIKTDGKMDKKEFKEFVEKQAGIIIKWIVSGKILGCGEKLAITNFVNRIRIELNRR